MKRQESDWSNWVTIIAATFKISREAAVKILIPIWIKIFEEEK